MHIKQIFHLNFVPPYKLALNTMVFQSKNVQCDDFKFQINELATHETTNRTTRKRKHFSSFNQTFEVRSKLKLKHIRNTRKQIHQNLKFSPFYYYCFQQLLS